MAVAGVFGALCAMAATVVPAAAQECLIGEVRWFAGNFAPRNWALANGQLLPINQNTALFSVLGTAYGGDGRTNFALPDLRGRAPIGAGQGPGLSNRPLGEKAGAETVALTAAQIPAHSHPAATTVDISATLRAVNTDKNNVKEPAGNVLADADNGVYHPGPADVDMGPSAITANATAQTTVQPSGAGQPHPNMPPYQTLTPIVCVNGLYPSRN
jgi:microcystin-dependent protein